MQPSFSGLLVTWAYLPHTTLPPGVTSPSSLTFTCAHTCFTVVLRGNAVLQAIPGQRRPKQELHAYMHSLSSTCMGCANMRAGPGCC